jgi:hypothetical protein
MSESEDYPERIEDSEDYSTQRRLKSVFDIRKDIHQTRKKIRFASHKPNERYQAVCAYRALAESYLLEIEPLLRRYGDGDYYLNKSNFGSVTLQPETRDTSTNRLGGVELFFPNAPISNYKDRSSWIRVNADSIPEPVTYEFTGLATLFDVPDTLMLTGQVRQAGSYYRQKEHTYVQKSQIPMSALDDMVRTMNEFLSDIGFELEPETEDNPANISV